MATEYEHEGIIYHEPRPRIVLVNFPSVINEELKSRGHNSVVCGEVGSTPIELRFPQPASEVDILVFRDSNMNPGRPESPSPQRNFHQNAKVNGVGFTFQLSHYVQELLSRGGVCVYLIGYDHCHLYNRSGLSPGIRIDISLSPTKSAFRIAASKFCEELTTFIKRWKTTPLAMVGFTAYQSEHFESLIQDSSGTALAFLERIPTAHSKPGYLLCLPDYGHNPEILDELLSQVLPSIAQHLFPFRHDLSWLKEKDFLSPGIAELEKEKETARQEVNRQISALDKQIETIQKEEQFLSDLLTSDGDKLKLAVKTGLEVLLGHAGLLVPVLDVDKDSALRDGATPKREDLRIEYEGNVILLNVTGREQFLRPTSLNQISKHHRLFPMSPDRPLDKLHSLLIANYNYGKGLDPRKRDDMFGTGTAEAEQRLQAEGHGAITTFDLFQLVRACLAKEVVLTQDHLTDLFTTVGILDFKSFKATLSAKA